MSENIKMRRIDGIWDEISNQWRLDIFSQNLGEVNEIKPVIFLMI